MLRKYYWLTCVVYILGIMFIPPLLAPFCEDSAMKVFGHWYLFLAIMIIGWGIGNLLNLMLFAIKR